MNIATLGDVLSVSIRNMWIGVIGFIPNLLIAFVIILLGWLIGVLLGRVVAQIIKAIKIDEALRRAGVEEFLNRGGLNLNSGAFLGGLVR